MLIREGCFSRGRLFNNFTSRVRVYSSERLFEGALVRGITVYTLESDASVNQFSTRQSIYHKH